MADRTSRITLHVRDAFSATLRTFNAGLAGAEVKLNALDRASIRMEQVGRRMTLFLTLPVVGAGVAATKMAADFDVAMRNVQSIAKVSDKEISEIGKSVLALSQKLPQSAQELAKGLYDIYSSGFKGAEALDVLKQSAMAASAGLSSTAVSARAITGVLNAYGRQAYSAAEVSDILFRTVDLGVITFEELAQSIGQVLPTASALKVPLETVGAALATLTRRGLDADMAVVSLNRILLSILDPSKEAKKLAAALGLEWNRQALESKGLIGVLEDMLDKTGGSAEAVATLTGEVRALRAALSLTQDGGALFNEMLTEQEQAAGATRRALDEQSKSLALQATIMKNMVIAKALDLAERVFPVLIAMVKRVQTAFSQMSEETTIKVVAVAALFAAAGPLLVGIRLVITGIKALTAAFAIFKVAGVKEISITVAAILALSYGIENLISLVKGQGVVSVEEFMRRVGNAFDWLAEKLAVKPILGELEKSLDVGKRFEDLLADLKREGEETARAMTEVGGVPYGPPKSLMAVNEAIKQYSRSAEEAEAIMDALANRMGAVDAAAKEAKISVSSFADELARMHPVSLILSERILNLKAAQEGLTAAIRANREAIRAAQEEYRRISEHLSSLNKQLSDAKSRLEELSRPRLVGMVAFEEQLFQIDQQLKRLRLAEIRGIPVTRLFPAMPAQFRGMTREQLEKRREQLELEQALTFDARLRQLAAAAHPAAPELTFEEAMARIQSTHAEIGRLEAEITSTEGALRAQAEAIRGLEAEGERLAAAMEALSLSLHTAEQAQRSVIDAVTLAIKWFAEDREELIKTGKVSEEQLEAVDNAVREMLVSCDTFLTDTTAKAITKLEEAIKKFKTIKSEMSAGITIPVYFEGIESSPLQRGGIMAHRGMALVGEKGPELVELPGGSRVRSNEETAALLSGRTIVSSDVIINIGLYTGSQQELQEVARVVGMALGREPGFLERMRRVTRA